MEHFNIKTKNNVASSFLRSRKKDKKPNSEKMRVKSNTGGLQLSFSCCYGLAAGGNKSATRPLERKRQKPVGRDKGSLTEQQTEGTGTATVQIRGIHKTKQTTQQSRSP